MKDFKLEMISVVILTMKRLIKKSERYRRRARVVRPTLNRVTRNEWSYCNSCSTCVCVRRQCAITYPQYALSGHFFYLEVGRHRDRSENKHFY